jgi:hypothetical protein
VQAGAVFGLLPGAASGTLCGVEIERLRAIGGHEGGG